MTKIYGDFLGERVSIIRTDIYKETQKEFCKTLNEFLKLKKKTKVPPSFKFTQNTISLLENDSKLSRDKFLFLLNFYYETKGINPAWVIIEDNTGIPKFLAKLGIDNNLLKKQKELETHTESIKRIVDDIYIIIENSASDQSSN